MDSWLFRNGFNMDSWLSRNGFKKHSKRMHVDMIQYGFIQNSSSQTKHSPETSVGLRLALRAFSCCCYSSDAFWAMPFFLWRSWCFGSPELCFGKLANLLKWIWLRNFLSLYTPHSFPKEAAAEASQPHPNAELQKISSGCPPPMAG